MSKLVALLLLAVFAIARTPYHFTFPRDHFAHDAYRTEWWYFTGHLRARDGRRFGYELTFFRAGLVPHARRIVAGTSDWHAAQLYPAHFAITDENAKRFTFYETIAREALAQGDAPENALRVRANGWALDGVPQSAGKIAMHLRASRGADALDLTLQPLKAPAIHGRGGISRKGPCRSCASHYYSFTRIETRGTLTLDSAKIRVDGTTWMDHEFGSSELTASQSGWDWFSLQLSDGREAMLYRMRERNGRFTPQSSGSLVERDGTVHTFAFAQCTYREEATWHSPHTDATYPSRWFVRVPGIARDLRIVPAVDDQELVDPHGELTYWEGAVRIEDAHTRAMLGEGYVELTGYAGKLAI